MICVYSTVWWPDFICADATVSVDNVQAQIQSGIDEVKSEVKNSLVSYFCMLYFSKSHTLLSHAQIGKRPHSPELCWGDADNWKLPLPGSNKDLLVPLLKTTSSRVSHANPLFHNPDPKSVFVPFRQPSDWNRPLLEAFSTDTLTVFKAASEGCVQPPRKIRLTDAFNQILTELISECALSLILKVLFEINQSFVPFLRFPL